MAKTVTEEHKEIFHYTTGMGLQGIISSQCLWATQISFLNDAEEQVAFFERRAPTILDEPTRKAADQLMTQPLLREKIEGVGGYECYVADQKLTLVNAMRKATLAFDDPYVVSFCTSKDEKVIQDGLLSQWRAYGPDGGYAIAFDTEKLEELLKKEFNSFAYQLATWGDVYYHHTLRTQEEIPEEIKEAEDVVKSCAFHFLTTGRENAFEPAYEKLSYLSSIYKHWGFHEERELRIVMVRTHSEVFAEEQKLGQSRPRKAIKFFQRNGCLIPYAPLFNFSEPCEPDASRLPITKIVVGPHPDKQKRMRAVESLLSAYGLAAEVTVSSIPYVGK